MTKIEDKPIEFHAEPSDEFEFDDDHESTFMADNVKLLMKLRESERNRKQKLRDAKTEQAKKDA